MNDPELNELNTNQRRLLQFGVILILALFLIGYFWFMNMNKRPNTPTVKNTTVYLKDNMLHIFDDTIAQPVFPDKLLMHYPYLLIVKPENQITTIYNLNTKQKDKEIKQILLDYDGTNLLINKGKTTVFNDKDLKILCQYGWIKSNHEVLCVTQTQTNSLNNKLEDIDLTANTQKDIYVSQNLIVALSIINNSTYLGELKYLTHTNYLIKDQNPIVVPSPVSMIYEINGKPYFASFKSSLNNEVSYYSIDSNVVREQLGGKISFVK